MSISLWKEALYLGFGSGVKIRVESNKGKHIRKMIEHFGCVLSPDGQLEFGSSGRSQDQVLEAEAIWRENVVECSDTELPRGSVVTEAMWELYELNFRFDLVMLDRALTKSNEWDAEKQRERQLKIEMCFHNGDDDFQFGYPTIRSVNGGLASDNLEMCFLYMRRLARLMLDWNTPIPTTITGLMDIKSPNSTDMRNFELVVAEFYCQTYYSQLDRAPLTPHRLMPPSRI